MTPPAPPRRAPRYAAAVPATPATVHHPALSLWQSIVHRAVTDDAGLHASAGHPAMAATSAAARAICAGAAPAAESPVAAAAALYARLAVAKFEGDAAAVTRIEDELRYSAFDPLWAELLIQYERSLLEQRVDAYVRHRTMDDFILDPLPDTVTIALVADWATGTPAARALLEQVTTFQPDVLVHLGDVYFSGLPEEGRAHFFDVVDAVFAARRPRVLALAGNHDRYSGGRGWVELTRRLGQPASYFCVQNAAWQILAMDTGYHDRNPLRRDENVTALEPSELAWHLDKIRRFGKDRGTILLSHHQLFSAKGIGGQEGKPLAVNPNLHDGFAPVLGDVALWFWGHEHNLSICAPYAGLARGRGIGSGAIPVFVGQEPYAPAEGLVTPTGESGPPAILPGTELGNNGTVYHHAFTILRLEGTRATASYYQADTSGGAAGVAEELFRETVERGGSVMRLSKEPR